MRLAPWAVMFVVFAAGCFGADSSTGPESGDLPGRSDLAPGCDGNRTAIAHQPGGIAMDWDGPLPVPCLTRTGYASGEPTIGITSSGTVFLNPALDSIQGSPVFGGVRPGVAWTSDEGATWQRIVPTLASEEAQRATVDPYLYVDPATDRVFVDNLLPSLNCSLLSWSDDEGATWDHSMAGCFETDHQTVFAGPPTTTTTLGYPNVVYRCAISAAALLTTSFASTCQSSLDGGVSWLPPGEPAFVTDPTRTGHADVPGWCDGGVGHGHVDATGRVYVPKGWCGQPWLAMSDDQGLTWTRVQVADNGMPRSYAGTDAHEAGVGVDAEGNVYYAWIARDRLPYIAVSRDRGSTWSDPLMVGIPGLKESTHPAFAVTLEGGFAFAYIGSENSAGAPFDEGEGCFPNAAPCVQRYLGGAPGYENTTWNGYITMGFGAADGTPLLLSAATNDPADPLLRGPCALGGEPCPVLYDFIDVQVAPDGTPWASFVDGCVGPCITGETMENNEAEGVAGRLWNGPSLH